MPSGKRKKREGLMDYFSKHLGDPRAKKFVLRERAPVAAADATGPQNQPLLQAHTPIHGVDDVAKEFMDHFFKPVGKYMDVIFNWGKIRAPHDKQGNR